MKKILVPIKRVPDWQVKVKVDSSSKSIDQSNLKWIINTFDEIAVEEAVRIKEKFPSSFEVFVLTIGPAACSEQLRSALALGADRAVHIISDLEVDSEQASKIISEKIKDLQIDLVLMGKQAIDSDSSQTGQRIAALLSWPQATFASKIELDQSFTSATVVREVDGGLETVKIKLPGLVTTDLRLNEPRLRSLPAIVAAKKKPIEEIQISSLSSYSPSKVEILSLAVPPKRSQGKKVSTVEELVELLKNEAKVI